MKRTLSGSIRLAATVLALVALLMPAVGQAEEGSTADQIRALINEGNQYVSEHKMDQAGGVSKDGSLQFWSSGGLMQWAPPTGEPTVYESYSLAAKHIEVIELPGGDAAVAMYYSEGSMHRKGAAPVSHYLTRVLEVYVKEDGEWVSRAAHWSPILGGTGTNQTSLD